MFCRPSTDITRRLLHRRTRILASVSTNKDFTVLASDSSVNYNAVSTSYFLFSSLCAYSATCIDTVRILIVSADKNMLHLRHWVPCWSALYIAKCSEHITYQLDMSLVHNILLLDASSTPSIFLVYYWQIFLKFQVCSNPRRPLYAIAKWRDHKEGCQAGWSNLFVLALEQK